MLPDLEFIRIAGSIRGRAKSPKPQERNSTKDYVRNYKQIMQNKANLPNVQMNITYLTTMFYTIIVGLATPKTNPKQTQFKANLSQNKPNLTQYKANSNPISNDINGLDNNLCNCYISLSEFLYGQNVKIGKGSYHEQNHSSKIPQA